MVQAAKAIRYWKRKLHPPAKDRLSILLRKEKAWRRRLTIARNKLSTLKRNITRERKQNQTTRTTTIMPFIEQQPGTHQQKRGTIECDDLTVEVVTTDERVAFGRKEYLVRPVSGGGQKWILAARLRETSSNGE